MSRFAKQLIYGGFYLAISGAVIWGAYRSVVPAPTCIDGVQNQNEEGVDCGAACGKSCPVALQLLEISVVQIISYGNGNSDVLIKLDNPNANYGAMMVPYILTVSDQAGEILTTKQNTTFVNPLESHYVVLPLVGITGIPVKADLQIDTTGVQWAALAIQGGSSIEFAAQQDQLISSANGLRYRANILNNSEFDFNQVEVAVLVYDEAGKIVGTGSTILSTLIASQLREAVIDWPFAIPSATRIQTYITTNVFNNDNYIRTYGSQERFQGF